MSFPLLAARSSRRIPVTLILEHRHHLRRPLYRQQGPPGWERPCRQSESPGNGSMNLAQELSDV